MRIDGKAIAEKMLTDLAEEVRTLKITPTLAVIMAGDNPASLSYIKQKQLTAEKIGAKIILYQIKQEELESLIKKCNDDPNIHGLIVQRPLPHDLGDTTLLLNSIKVDKDVDGFVPNSKFTVPVAAAVEKILQVTGSDPVKKRVVVIGRGETAGKPIFIYFQKLGYLVSQIHSKTENPDEIIRSADIVISCVGKNNVVRRDNIKQDCVLIGVGLWRDEAGKLRGDYEEGEIKDVAAFYTPTPGGVGPVNVACLMQNLVLATQKIIH